MAFFHVFQSFLKHFCLLRKVKVVKMLGMMEEKHLPLRCLTNLRHLITKQL